MKRIKLSDGREYATNKGGDGVFLRARSGSWLQCAGTGQAHADTPQALRRILRDRFEVRGVRIVATYGWDQ